MSWLRPGRRSPAQLDELLAASQRSALTYDHPGSTLRDHPPPGIADRSFHLEVEGELAAARDALHRWATHRGIGAHVHPMPPAAGLREGDTVLVVVPVGPAEAVIPNRIVAVGDDANRVAMAYGTLPDHPESGEELFLAEQTSPGHLRLTVRIHARAATPVVRAAGPVATRLQAIAARRYLRAWAAALTEGTN